MIKEGQREANFKRIQDARRRKEAILQGALINDLDVDIILAELQNDMAEELAKHEEPIEILLFGDNKAEHEGKWKTYWDNQLRLEKHKRQMFSMILGHCSQHLIDQMKQYVMWATVATLNNLLQLISIIEKTVLIQTEDHYPFAIVYKQELSLYSFHQNTMTNDQWYEQFNTKVDFGTAIGVTRYH